MRDPRERTRHGVAAPADRGERRQLRLELVDSARRLAADGELPALPTAVPSLAARPTRAVLTLVRPDAPAAAPGREGGQA